MGFIQINDPVEIKPQDAVAANWQLRAGTTDVWLLPLSADARLNEVLQQDELEKAKRLQHEKSRAQYITARAGLRLLSANYLKADPSALVYATTGKRKPCWQAPYNQLHFNMAHSGDYVIICFAQTETGVDIEKRNERFNYQDLLPRCFTKEEISAIQNASDPRSRFYLYWTRKEALLKALGTGLHQEPATIPCLTGRHSNTTIQTNWIIDSFILNQTFIALAGDLQQHEGYRFFTINLMLEAVSL